MGGTQFAEDPFAVLGLTHNATLKQIKNAYIKLVSKYHPDRYVSKSHNAKIAAEEKMKDINVAEGQDIIDSLHFRGERILLPELISKMWRLW